MDEDIRELLHRLYTKSRRNYSSLLQPLHLHVGQEQALCQLWKEDGITQLELSARLGCEPPTVSGMLRKLEHHGLIERRRGIEDLRISRVFLTDKGRALQEPVYAIWQNQQNKLLDGISPEDKLLLRELLQTMLQNLT